MTEVSCRVFDIKLRDLKRRKLSPELLIKGTSTSAHTLANPKARISWVEYVRIMRNVGKIWTDEEMMALGGAFYRNPLIRPVALVGLLLFEVRDFYKWIGTAEGGATQQWFTAIAPTFRDLGQGKIELVCATKPGFEPCREFFIISHGSFRDLPLLFGAGQAQVEMSVVDGVGTFTIAIPPTNKLLKTLRGAIRWPFAARHVAAELKDANASLQSRFEELQQAQKLLDGQAKQLRIANTITGLIHAELELDKTLRRVIEALVEVAGFKRARIALSYVSTESKIERDYSFGKNELDTSTMLSVPLSARGVSLGSLEVWRGGSETEVFDRTLLENVVPSICMAIDEAVAFTLVNEYRNTLEQKVTDRTQELQRARDSLAHTVEDLEAAQAVRSRIFANINHEIRTPLSLVLLSAGEIRVRHLNKNDPKTLASVASIDAACERLLSMVDSMLLLAAGQEGKLKIHRRNCDIALEIRRLVSIWTPLAREHKLNLNYDGPERLDGYVDTAALERIMANLLSNAIKYTPDTGSIGVTLKQDSNKLLIAIRDTGIGIDEEFKKRIFGRFEQGRAAVRQGARSTGIGLSIVKELIEAHGGAVTVDANRGGGTVFNIVLPVVAPEQQTDAVPETTQFNGHSLPAGFGLRAVSEESPTVLAPDGQALATILVAEDDSGLRSSIGDLLLNAGYKVLLAPDGFAALKLAGEYYPDMLCSDVGMPGMDGLELSRKFRDLPGNRLAPVLLLTAFGTTTDKLSGFQAGAIDYMVKPFEPKELIARVESQLKLRDLALRLSRSEKLASLGTMSAGLAHEIRNPANGLLNALDPLVSMLPPEVLDAESGTGQLLEVVRDCANQIGRLSRQLLGFKNDGALTCTEENVQNLVKRALSMTDPKRGNVEVRVRHAYGDRVKCAAPLMLQVLVNIVDNAIQAAGSGGWIEVATRLDGDKVVFDVSDSGSGVPAELRERVFEPFFTTKSAGQGTGLGLSTSRHIVEQHHGTLRVVEGVRSTFSVALPLNGPAQGSVPMNGAREERSQVAS